MCRNAKTLLIMSTLFTFGMGLSNIFVNVFFWRQTSDFKIIVLYNMTHYIVIPLIFILGGIIAKRKNGIWPLRFGLLAYALFFCFILLVGGRGPLYIYLLGVLHGIGSGFYWLAFNTLCFDYTDIGNRDTFNGFNGSCCGAASAVAPIISAYIISSFAGMSGYRIVFTITLIIFVVLVLISMTLQCKNYSGSLNYKKVFSRNGEEWSEIRVVTALWGIRDVIIVFVVNILIMETTGSELSLGKLTLVASLISSVSYMLVQRIIKPPKRRLAIFIGVVGSFMGVFAIAMHLKLPTLLIYIVLDSFFIPFFLIQLSSTTYNVINRAHDEDMRIEYMISKDISLNIGCLVSGGILLLLLNMTSGAAVWKGYLIFLGLAPIAAGYFLGRLKNALLGSCD